LWSTIVSNLNDSAYFIILASTTAAASKWVRKEVCHWITGGSCDEPEKLEASQIKPAQIERMILVLTEGTIAWDDTRSDFDWTKTTALPESILKKVFVGEPFCVDLSWVRTEGQRLDRTNKLFMEAVARLCAPIRNLDIEALIGEDYREHRRTLVLFRWLTIGLTIGIILTIASSWFALRQRDEAVARERQTRHEQGLGFLAHSMACERRKDYLAAKLMAMKAVNFHQFGSPTNSDEDLLRLGSAEHHEAITRIVSMPECNLLYAAHIESNSNILNIRCSFNHVGTKVLALSDNDNAISIDFASGQLERRQRTLEDLNHFNQGFTFNQSTDTDTCTSSIKLSNGETVCIKLEGRNGRVKWSGSGAATDIPEDSLAGDENDLDAEVVELEGAEEAPVALAAFKNTYIQSIVALRDGEATTIKKYKGEMSEESGAIRNIDQCISSDGTLIVASESNRRNNEVDPVLRPGLRKVKL
jgi:hypothetical protein